ncbi:MAG: PEP-CTERM sorting domain-containing protein [Pseudomonadota bacterium]|nr:PEP-CTERM sorting domain-containing protein [Pseudomonadota bacterium]
MNGSWYQANVGSGGTVGITSTYQRAGNGSAFFSTMSGDSKGDLQYSFGSLTPLSSLTSLSYEFYRDGASTTGSNFAPVVRFDIAKNGSFAGSLVFEDFYQSQTAPPTDTWTTLSATLTSGIFWATNAALGPTFAAANGGQKTLSQWIADNAGSSLSVYGMTTGVGSGWSGTFSGAIDNVNVAFGDGPSFLSNFEVAPAADVPEPSSILITLGGIGALSLFRRRQAN